MIIFNALQTTLTGGIGRYCYELSKALYNNEPNIKIVIREEDIKLFKFVKDEDLIIAKNISNSFRRNIFEQFKLPLLINKLYPNAILHYPDTMAPILSKNKVVITVHDLAFKSLTKAFTWKTNVWKNVITNISVKKAYKIIAISDFTKNEIKEVYGEEITNKTKVVLNGFNDFSNEEIITNNIKEDMKSLEDKDFILTVSTISPRKNIDGLIKAFNNSKSSKSHNLVIAGGNGWLFEDIFELVKDLNIEDKVIFTGRINDEELKFLYKNCRVFSYVSFYEGFGLPPLEAMSYKKPCLVSNISSIPEVVGDAAIKVDPYNIDNITQGLDTLCFNEEEKYKYIELGEKNILRFSWEKCAKETYKIYA